MIIKIKKFKKKKKREIFSKFALNIFHPPQCEFYIFLPFKYLILFTSYSIIIDDSKIKL